MNIFKRKPKQTVVPEFQYIDEKKYSLEDLARMQLCGIKIDFNEEGDVDSNLDENEKKELYAEAAIISNNKAFRKIADSLISSQGNYSIKHAADMNAVSFGRATINGIMLFKEEMERLASLNREEEEEEFDKYEVV